MTKRTGRRALVAYVSTSATLWLITFALPLMARGSVYKRCPCGTTGMPGKRACKKAHGTWWWRAEASRDPETGKRRQPSQGGYATQAEAADGLADFMNLRSEGRWRDDKGITVSQWFDRWLADGRWEKLTRETYESHLRSVWRKRIGRIRLRDLRKHHIEDVLREVTAVDEDRHRSARTLASYRATLRASMAAAIDAGFIASNPAAGTMRSLPGVRRAELNIWEPEQLRLFLAVTVDKRDHRLWRVAAFTGLRRAELCGMRWADVDLEGDHPGVTIRQTVNALAGLQPCIVCNGEHRGAFIKPDPKSDRGRRWVPLVPEAIAALREHRRNQLEVRLAWGEAWSAHDLVFCREDGTPLNPSSLTQNFKAMVEGVRRPGDPKFRLPVIRPHDMRHGAASLMLAAGVSVEIVAMILGHSPKVTRDIYAHVLRGPATAAMEAAAQLVRGGDGAQSVHSQAASNAGKEVTDLRNRRSEATDPVGPPEDYCMTNSGDPMSPDDRQFSPGN